MDFIADLHIHSPFSRATSKESTLAGLAAWARIKGIQVVGTGDFTHPGWLRCLKEELVPAEPGLFRLKDEARLVSPLPGVTLSASPIRFLLTAEVSSIYKRLGQVRKVHNLLYVPDFASAERLAARLAAIGNIESDGRPILGLDSRDLLEILLEQAPEGFLVPAHIWTPWFSLFGSKSGFDLIDDCYADLTPHVFALETGLSSDPEMNRLISALDRFALISNSDCHSPQKLGREANLFSTELSFQALRDAIRGNRRETFRGTVEFFPEEGKYHFDGHRACNVCLDPHETRRLGLLCPVCGRPLTVGVHHRVMELADREAPLFAPDAPLFYSLIPLPEVLGELLGVGPASKEVMHQYGRVIARFGSEFGLLLEAPLQEIADHAPLLSEAVRRVREGQVIRHPGYDGEYGVIRVFEEGELMRLAGQGNLFGDGAPRKGRKKKEPAAPLAPVARKAEATAEEAPATGPNPEQAEAIRCDGEKLLVAAGPGTGKTYTLVQRLARLLEEGADPARICAITFTTRAADELRARLVATVGPAGAGLFVGTFHRFCLDWLKRGAPELTVVGPESRERLLKRLFPELGGTRRGEIAADIAGFLERSGAGTPPADPPEPVRRYLAELGRLKGIDLDGIVPSFVARLAADPFLRRQVAGSVGHLFVDEFQDLNGSQYALVELLSAGARLFAIGDPDQAIYGFRGSDLHFFFRLAGLPETRQLSLVRNYRSAPAIIEAATGVIRNNRERSNLPLTAHRAVKGVIELYEAPTPAAEAEFMVRRIEELMGGVESFSLNSGRGGDQGRGRSFGDFAILCRLGKQTEEIGLALERRGIPFQQVGATPYFMAPSARPLYRFIQAAAGSDDIADWLLLAGSLPGIGSATLDHLEASLPLTGDFFALVTRVETPPAARATLAGLRRALEEFHGELAASGLAAALEGARAFLAVDRGDAGPARLLTLAASFGSDLAGFAGHLARLSRATVYDERAEAVALMTIHAAKGLEFPVVFLAGAEEGLLPCTLMGGTEIEEERRLFYVGLTRAKERLLLTSAATRPWAGPGPRRLSRFVGEIPERLVTMGGNEGRKGKGKKDAGQMELF